VAQVRHAFASAKGDGADPTEVQPSNWNADHEGIILVRKTADQTVNNSEALVDDDDLKAAMAANEVWAFELLVIVDSPTAADVRIAFDVPSGSTLTWSGVGLDPSATDATGVAVPNMQEAAGANLNFGVVAGARWPIKIWGIVECGVTPGDLQTKFAQVAATVGDTTVKENSWLKAFRLA